jgi:hypothetical protein
MLIKKCTELKEQRRGKMKKSRIKIIHEDKYILVVYKESNLLTISTDNVKDKNLKPLTAFVEGIKNTTDKIYEFLTGNEKKNEEPDFFKNKFSFLEDILLMGIETNEKGFSNLEKKLSFNFASAGGIDYSSSIDEIKNTLQAHMTKSAEDRTNMINLMNEMSMFNYHQGDPKKAWKYLRNAVKWSFKSPFELSKFSLDKTMDFGKFVVKFYNLSGNNEQK